MAQNKTDNYTIRLQNEICEHTFSYIFSKRLILIHHFQGFDKSYTICSLLCNSTSFYFLMLAWLWELCRLKKFDEEDPSKFHLLRYCSKYKLIYFQTISIYKQSVFFFYSILRSPLYHLLISNRPYIINTFFKLEFLFSNYNCFYIFNWFLYLFKHFGKIYI